jgi:hypothetical protein
MKSKVKAFAKAMSVLIAKANKVRTEKGTKRIYDSEILNVAIGTALNGKVMPKGENARLWCLTNGAVIVDVRSIVHENKGDDASHLRPENTVRARLITLAKLNKDIAKLAYVRYLTNGTPSADDANNDDAYKVFIYRKR